MQVGHPGCHAPHCAMLFSWVPSGSTPAIRDQAATPTQELVLGLLGGTDSIEDTILSPFVVGKTASAVDSLAGLAVGPARHAAPPRRQMPPLFDSPLSAGGGIVGGHDKDGEAAWVVREFAQRVPAQRRLRPSERPAQMA